MYFEIFKGIMIPFLGTLLGSACVFFIKNGLNIKFREAISGFAGGVMTAASVWSLLIPALESEASMDLGIFSFFPAVAGLWFGVIFLLSADRIIPETDLSAKPYADKENRLLFLSVTLHNLPEGMAVGVVYAAMLSSGNFANLSSAIALSIGIGIQNLPEGAIISIPLAGGGMKKFKAFIYGVLSAVIEPIGALLTLAAVSVILPLLPYLLGFAAGAMIYVVLKELSPIITGNERSNLGIIFFSVGFSIMMILDVALG